MKISKKVFIAFLLILGIGLGLQAGKIKNIFELLNQQQFVDDAKTLVNLAASYFNRHLDPLIDKSEKNEGTVKVTDLIKEQFPNRLKKYTGTIKIVISANYQGQYYLDIKSPKYEYRGSLTDLKKENLIKLPT